MNEGFQADTGVVFQEEKNQCGVNGSEWKRMDSGQHGVSKPVVQH